ncbi:MAG: DUF2798 domain-containing protein [Spirochaetales bacterium]|nr:DUF2798 domain-containing protein [Spirochaetales bacterium]
MPKTWFQDLVFTVIMVLIMVYCMTLYNTVLQNGFSYSTFPASLQIMWPEALVAFILQRYVAKRIVKKLLPRLINVEDSKPLFISVSTAGLTVFLMAPMMTLSVTIMHNGITPQILIIWLKSLVLNFVFALCIQIFYVGPFVRFLFNLLFNKIFIKHDRNVV